jgi:hypothetical protein
MLLNHPLLVVALACVANALVFAIFNDGQQSHPPKEKPILTILKVLALNAVALGGLFVMFGESRPEIYMDPVNF